MTTTVLPRVNYLNVRHTVQEGGLTPVEFTFSLEGALSCTLRLDGWVIPILARFDGRLTVGEIFNHYLRSGQLPEGFGLRAFVDLVVMLVERGFLQDTAAD